MVSIYSKGFSEFQGWPHIPSAFLWFIKPEVRRVEVTPHQVILPVFAGLELLCAAFHQTLILKWKWCPLHPQGWEPGEGRCLWTCPTQELGVLTLRQTAPVQAPKMTVSPTMSCLSDRIWNKESCHSRMWMSSRCPEGKARLQKEHVFLCRVW